MCSFSSNKDLVVIINPVLPWFEMITSLTFGLLRPNPANVGPMSDIDRIGIEHLVKNDGIIVVWDNRRTGKNTGVEGLLRCPIFDRYFPTYVRVSIS